MHVSIMACLDGSKGRFPARSANSSGAPLLIVPEGFASVAEHVPRRMLFAVDGSEIALDALRTGLTFSRADTEFRAKYVVDPPQCWATSSLAGHWKKH
ncbi:hypothetical protein BC2230_30400 [Burkholderia cepacia]